jgi:hypothetical protein
MSRLAPALPLALVLACISPPALAEGPPAQVPPAATLLVLEGVTLQVERLELELLLGPDDLARLLRLLEREGVAGGGPAEGGAATPPARP